MSTQEQPGFDFWEFVSCAKCRMPFALGNGSATIPFWLTECGHVICNSHLNPDQSCSQCGTRDIQLAPLQREMEAPMSDWFRPLPQALDSISYAIKFQQDALATQLRYYRSRHQQFRQVFDRIKKELSDSKKENEALRRENEHFRLQLYQQGDEGYSTNANGKRQKKSVYDRSGLSSSSRSIHTPIAPNRLTLQLGQSVPELSHGAEQNSRPVSSLSLEQYAYKGTDDQGYAPLTLTHAQSAPLAFQRLQSSQPRSQKDDLQNLNNDAIPSSSRFKPAGLPPASLSRKNLTGKFGRPHADMGPPPTPQYHPHQTMNFAGNSLNATSHASRQQINIPSTSSGQRPAASASTPQRFFQNGFLPSSSRTGGSRPNTNGIPPVTGQRLSFTNIPGAPN